MDISDDESILDFIDEDWSPRRKREFLCTQQVSLDTGVLNDIHREMKRRKMDKRSLEFADHPHAAESTVVVIPRRKTQGNPDHSIGVDTRALPCQVEVVTEVIAEFAVKKACASGLPPAESERHVSYHHSAKVSPAHNFIGHFLVVEGILDGEWEAEV